MNKFNSSKTGLGFRRPNLYAVAVALGMLIHFFRMAVFLKIFNYHYKLLAYISLQIGIRL